MLDKQSFIPEDQKNMEKNLLKKLPKGQGNISYRVDLSQTCIIVSIETFSQVDPENLKDIEEILCTAVPKEKDVLLELYCEEKLYYQNLISGVLSSKEDRGKQELAEEFIMTLFTSDQDRYNNFENGLSEEYSPISNQTNFLEYPGQEKYVKVYKKFCTDNCLNNMGNEHLFTYLDFLAMKASKDVKCTNVRFNKMDGESSEEFDNVGLYFVADLEDNASSYSVTGKVYVQGYENQSDKINGIIFFDYASLSKDVIGNNIYN